MWRAIHDVSNVQSGYPFRARVLPEPGGDIAVIQIRDVEQQTWNSPERVLWVSNCNQRFDKYALAPGDVLFQSRGTRNVAIEFPVSMRATPASGMYYLRPDMTKIEPAYLAWCINHPRSQQAIRDAARGSHIAFVSKSDLGAIKIPVPSLEAQRQILEVVRLRARERELTDRRSAALDQCIDAVTWGIATGTKHKRP